MFFKISIIATIVGALLWIGSSFVERIIRKKQMKND